MSGTFNSAVIVGLGLLLGVSLARAELVVYPAKGQSPAQQDRDKFECRQWAQQETGVGSSQPAQVASAPPPSGGAVRGAARGAAVGAIGGAIGGNAGKGAAIGAGVGGAVGLVRQGRARREQAAAQQQATSQAQANAKAFDRAYSACLSGRGYTVR
jgi:OmpA family protein